MEVFYILPVDQFRVLVIRACLTTVAELAHTEDDAGQASHIFRVNFKDTEPRADRSLANDGFDIGSDRPLGTFRDFAGSVDDRSEERRVGKECRL